MHSSSVPPASVVIQGVCVCLGGCLPLGWVGYLPRGVCLWPVMHAGKPPLPRTEGHTRVKTLPCPKLRLWEVKIGISSMRYLQLLPLLMIDIGPSSRKYFFRQVEWREILEMFLCTFEENNPRSRTRHHPCQPTLSLPDYVLFWFGKTLPFL